MPVRAKGARLYWHPVRGKWVIRDSGRPELATGTDDRAAAERALAAYIANRDRKTGPRDPDRVLVAEVLDIYGTEHAPTVTAPQRIGSAIEALLPFWGKLTVDTIRAETCRRYAKSRTTSKGMPDGKTRPVSPATVRRELGTLRAALIHCHREGYLTSVPPVTLPDKPAANDRWLTRAEAARLLRAAMRAPRCRHMARFVLIGLYTGTRKQAALGLEFAPNDRGGWIDVDRGVMYRRAQGKAETAKRTPVARLPDKLLAHARRWQRLGRFPVEYQGAKVLDIKTAWATIAEEAGLPDITPHVLRHTAITWALQNGAAIWDVAGYFGASVQTIQDTYGHHSPAHQESARNAMDRRQPVRYPVRTTEAGAKD